MKLFVNIGKLCGVLESGVKCLRGGQMDDFAMLDDAWMAVDDSGCILRFGTGCAPTAELYGKGNTSNIPRECGNVEVVDLKGQWVFPAFCDSHTHIVYAGNRAGEFLDKINGLSYEEIGRRGGGILNSSDLLQATSEDSLFEQSIERVYEMIAKGTGAMEIKSGYGLTTESELKMLRVIDRIAREVDIPVMATFLGAHAVGRKYGSNRQGYIDMLCSEMIPAVAEQGIARFIDVFCDEGYFTPTDTLQILQAGAEVGLRPKIHANELGVSGGVQVGVACGALSVDHLERTGDEEIAALLDSQTMPTCLPGASFFSGLPYAPARKMIESGLPVALASDYNPGSSPSGDMRFVCSLGSIAMKLTPQQALNAATINGACAMELSAEAGSITPGKLANFFTTLPLPSLPYFLYAYTTPLITATYLRGNRFASTLR